MPFVSPRRPSPGNYHPYYQKYMDLLPDGDILQFMEEQGETAAQFFAGIGEEQADIRYAPGKWSIREVAGHVSDTERVFAYRALRFSRGDDTPLPGFEQDIYVKNGAANDRSMLSLAEEFRQLRISNVLLFRGFTPEMWQRRGTASDAPIITAAIPFLMAGHLQHHLNMIRNDYLKNI